MSGFQSTVGFAQELKTSSLPTVSGAAGTAGIPPYATITTAASHGFHVGDRVKMQGFNDAGYNTTVTVRSVPTATTFTFKTATVLPTLTGGDLGTIVSVSTVGTAKTPARFLEVTGFSVDGKPMRLFGKGMGAGRLFKRKDRVVPYVDEIAGDWSMECLTEGMGLLFLMALGAVETTGPTDDAYTHVFTPALLRGLSLTVQAIYVDDLDVEYVQTFVGCKVNTLKLDVAVNGLLMVSFGIDALDVVLDVPIATPSYSTTAELLSFFGASLTLDGQVFPNVTQLSVEINNNLATKRRHIGQAAMSEQADQGEREITISATAEFRGSGVIEKVKATTPAGALADVEVTCVGQTPIGEGATLPSLTILTPNLIIEEGPLNIDTAGLLTLNLKGHGLDSDMTADDALTITIVSGDSAP